jgi:hypothetical protein
VASKGDKQRGDETDNHDGSAGGESGLGGEGQGYDEPKCHKRSLREHGAHAGECRIRAGVHET